MTQICAPSSSCFFLYDERQKSGLHQNKLKTPTKRLYCQVHFRIKLILEKKKNFIIKFYGIAAAWLSGLYVTPINFNHFISFVDCISCIMHTCGFNAAFTCICKTRMIGFELINAFIDKRNRSNYEFYNMVECSHKIFLFGFQTIESTGMRNLEPLNLVSRGIPEKNTYFSGNWRWMLNT